MFILPCATQQEPKRCFQIPAASSKKMDTAGTQARAPPVSPGQPFAPGARRIRAPRPCCCTRAWDRSRIPTEPRGSRGRRRLPCQGTWGQRRAAPSPAAGVLPAETQSGSVCWPLPGRPRGSAQTLAWQLRLQPLNPSIQPRLSPCALGRGEPLSPGNLRPWRCVWCYFSHPVTTFNFLGKAHKLRWRLIHTEALILQCCFLEMLSFISLYSKTASLCKIELGLEDPLRQTRLSRQNLTIKGRNL